MLAVHTSLAATIVCCSFQTVSESTPIPPHGNLQKRDANDSETVVDSKFRYSLLTGQYRQEL